jgi:hypothetical protein
MTEDDTLLIPLSKEDVDFYVSTINLAMKK